MEARDLPEVEHYPNVVRFVAETPWALLPSTLAAITDFVRLRAAGHRLTEEEIQARIGNGAGPSPAGQTHGGVAVIPVYGVISPRATALSEISGGTNLDSLRAQLRAALGDSGVKAIVLDFNSPGGAVPGMTEFAAELRAASKQKPIVSVANSLMASAAYWLASQTNEVVASPSAWIGSIGVFGAHQDISQQQEQQGIKTTLISAGKYKTEGNPFEPLSDAARASLQETVNDEYEQFVSDVAAGRGVPAAAVRNGYGEGRVLTAARAVKAGLADRVGTLEETIARLAGSGGRSSSRSSFSKALTALPALKAECSREDALYSMALLMGGRGAAAFTDFPDVDHRELYDLVSEAYEAHGLEPPEYERSPAYDNVAFRHDERDVFADRYLRKALTTVTVGAVGFKGALSPETTDAAQAAVRELAALVERGSDSASTLSGMVADLRRATSTLKGS